MNTQGTTRYHSYCKAYLEDGVCGYGTKCKYPHATDFEDNWSVSAKLDFIIERLDTLTETLGSLVEDVSDITTRLNPLP